MAMYSITANKNSLLTDLEAISERLDVVLLEDLSGNNQMDRFDKKFLFHSSLITELLNKASCNYNILEANGTRIFNYCSDYYDTPDFKMYHDHHNGKTNRYKVRIREYLDSGDRFVELKHKNSKSFTTKKRIAYKKHFPLTPEAMLFVKENTIFEPGTLIHALTTRYNRITLVNKRKDERITIDFNLCLQAQNTEMVLKGLAIAEIKNNNRHLRTKFNQFLKEHHIKQDNFSKYCIGVALLNEQVKQNTFKEKILKIKKIENESIVYFS